MFGNLFNNRDDVKINYDGQKEQKLMEMTFVHHDYDFTVFFE